MDGQDVGLLQQIVIAGAGYAGLHVALRLAAGLQKHPAVTLTLVDQHDTIEVCHARMSSVMTQRRTVAELLSPARWAEDRRPTPCK